MGGGHLLTEILEQLDIRMSCVVPVERSSSPGSLEFPGHFRRDCLLEFPFDGKQGYVLRRPGLVVCSTGAAWKACLGSGSTVCSGLG